ncbi:MAG: dienelactone hydrolase family protein [Rhodospirillaceae bacterium]|nr:dienelactone hydrolase family protein [Rhodospirillaceae bacterium]
MAIDALSGPCRPAANGAPTAAVVILHGYGANGDDLISLAPFFAQTLPHVIFYAPNAPQPWEGGGYGGRQWFGLPGYDPNAMQRDPNLRGERFKAMSAGAAAASIPLNKFIDQVLAEHTLAPNRLALLGFSQGTMMSLYAGLRREKQLAAILGYSGALVGADRIAGEIKTKPPVCLVHGAADPVVPALCMADIDQALTPLGVSVATHLIPGLQHGIDPDGARIGAAFLQKFIG